jgi:hypothetical protein
LAIDGQRLPRQSAGVDPLVVRPEDQGVRDAAREPDEQQGRQSRQAMVRRRRRGHRRSLTLVGEGAGSESRTTAVTARSRVPCSFGVEIDVEVFEIGFVVAHQGVEGGVLRCRRRG